MPELGLRRADDILAASHGMLPGMVRVVFERLLGHINHDRQPLLDGLDDPAAISGVVCR